MGDEGSISRIISRKKQSVAGRPAGSALALSRGDCRSKIPDRRPFVMGLHKLLSGGTNENIINLQKEMLERMGTMTLRRKQRRNSPMLIFRRRPWHIFCDI
jgi:hypothetical protein